MQTELMAVSQSVAAHWQWERQQFLPRLLVTAWLPSWWRQEWPGQMRQHLSLSQHLSWLMNK
jgi:hypothetical protein